MRAELDSEEVWVPVSEREVHESWDGLYSDRGEKCMGAPLSPSLSLFSQRHLLGSFPRITTCTIHRRDSRGREGWMGAGGIAMEKGHHRTQHREILVVGRHTPHQAVTSRKSNQGHPTPSDSATLHASHPAYIFCQLPAFLLLLLSLRRISHLTSASLWICSTGVGLFWFSPFP